MDAPYLKAKFDTGLAYPDYLATGKPEQQENWTKIYNQVGLTDAQKQLLGGFTRKMHVIGLSGIWCGDCVQQGPLIQHIADGSDAVELRWVDRDEHIDLQEKLKINAGNRVPARVFCAEDFEFVSWFGDRTLTRYRAMAQRQLAGACPLPGAPVPDDELAGTLADWLDEFERVQLLLRLSGRLRQIHGD